MPAGEGSGPDEASGPELEIELPSKPEFVVVARHAIAALARLHELPDEVVDDAKIAVSEACTNAVTAQARAGVREPLSVRAEVDPGSLLVEVLDRGRGPGPAAVEAASSPATPSEAEFDSGEFSFETNLSLPLIRGLVDDMDVVAREGGGSVVRMRLPVASTD